ncbi:unnamed protein product [Rotaria sordida]|uniref:Uncharacterized protein n=1 Tax=Rotaria sordida TaxID=392033 RepID=A0A819A6Y6_9BILA|nr:unnamed protein product [Rotaria sordida]CAF3783034.1 unnamed protein product [Rotaria sordida]CAF4194173.1 unnamed protein product [Rotaria sordida]
MNELEQQYRNQLTTYAANDCLSIQRILISLNLIQLNSRHSSTHSYPTSTITNAHHTHIEFELLSDKDDLFTIQTTVNKSNVFILNHELLSEDIQVNTQRSVQITSTTQTLNQETNNDRTNQLELNLNISTDNHQEKINELSREERKRIHNCSCTLKQHKKLYQHEIIIHNIDHRFTITNIKMILRQNLLAFSAVNTSKLSRTNR